MPVQFTRTPVISASAKSQPIVEPCDEFKDKFDECVHCYRRAMTPLKRDDDLLAIADNVCDQKQEHR